MSIVVSVKVYDGIVLGADSQAQIHAADPQGNVGVVQTYSNARKLFQVGELPMGVGTWGTGNIGRRSIESLLLEFNTDEIPVGEPLSVEDAARKLLGFLQERHATEYGTRPETQQPKLGVLIAGYTQGSPLADEWEFRVPQDAEPRRVRPADQTGVSWRGIPLPFTRLYRGLDPRIPDQLRNLGVSQDVLAQIKGGMPMPIIFDNMPLQDAVDFAEFILDVTISVARFEAGVATCGGPLDLAVIRPGVGFKWLRQKPLESLTISQ